MDGSEVPYGPLALVAGRPTAEEAIGPGSTRQLALGAFRWALVALAVGGVVCAADPAAGLRLPAHVLVATALSAPTGLFAWRFVVAPVEVLAIAVARGVLNGALLYACVSPVVGLAALQGASMQAPAAIGAIVVGVASGAGAIHARLPTGPAYAAYAAQAAAGLVLLWQLAEVAP